MERYILNIRWTDRKNNNWIRKQTRFDDVGGDRVAENKLKWAARVKDNRWTKRIMERRPYERHRHRGRSERR